MEWRTVKKIRSWWDVWKYYEKRCKISIIWILKKMEKENKSNFYQIGGISIVWICLKGLNSWHTVMYHTIACFSFTRKEWRLLLLVYTIHFPSFHAYEKKIMVSTYPWIKKNGFFGVQGWGSSPLFALLTKKIKVFIICCNVLQFHEVLVYLYKLYFIQFQIFNPRRVMLIQICSNDE